MLNPSKKQRVTIQYLHPSRYINADSLFTKTKQSAMDIVSGKIWCARAWFRGELIFENKELIDLVSQ